MKDNTEQSKNLPLVHDCLSEAVMNGTARRSKNRVTSLEASPKLTSLEASPIMPLAQGCFARVNLLLGKFIRAVLSFPC